MGLWLVLYLIVHLVTNSQAALWLGEKGENFVRLVNSLESLPFLHAIEITLIGVPFAIHIVWGIQRALTAKNNSSQLKYGRNRAFTWQRLTSWILLFGVVGHVLQMRFLDQPKERQVGGSLKYVYVARFDPGLRALAAAVPFRLLSPDEQGQADPALQESPLREGEVLVIADSPGAGMLVMVRETFKSPWMVALYTIFLLAASFHAFNGVWTFLITWGVLLSYRSQRAMIPASVVGMGLLTFLGFAAIYGSYWMSRYA
jgi:succinate dehydrogenase / fumarate reductase cytochrome b subunit